MKKLSFKAKLLILCVGLCLVSVTIGVTSFLGLKKVSGSYRQVTNVGLPNVMLLSEMYLSYRNIRINLISLGFLKLSPEGVERVVKTIKEDSEVYEKADKAYNEVEFLPGEKELYDELNKYWQEYKKTVRDPIVEKYNSHLQEDKAALEVLFYKTGPTVASGFKSSMEKLIAFQNENAKKFVLEAEKTTDFVNYLILAICVFGCSAGLLAGVIYSNKINSTIQTIMNHLDDNAKNVSVAAKNIESTSQQLSQSTTEQSASLQETTASLEQITAMISKASESAVDTSTKSVESQQKAESGKSVVEQMLTAMTEISQSNEAIMDQINQSNEKMGEVVKVIQEIGTKTKVINEIVFQTKLLSFNASVEAARAGEHGKGFSVVAEEVGNLAQMSGNAAKEITEMLDISIPKVEAVVKETQERVEGLIIDGKQKVEFGSNIAHKCADILNEIVVNVTNVSELAQDISQASKEQALGVSEINKAMRMLDTVTQQNAATSESAASSAEKLSQQADSLNEILGELSDVIYGEKNASSSGLGTHTDSTGSDSVYRHAS